MSLVELQKYANSIPLSLTDAVAAKLEELMDLILRKNESMNLVGPVDRHDFRIKHIVDSLALARFWDVRPGMKILDLGTGGGLPGLPLALLFPEVDFTLMDATEKKIEAVNEFVQILGLTNVKTVAGRAETLAHDPAYREDFDRVVSRAVAPLQVLLELAIPFLHLNGRFIAYKGPEYVNELVYARRAFESLQAEPPQVKFFSLPEGKGERTLIIVPKLHQTPARFPRRDGMPAKRPL